MQNLPQKKLRRTMKKKIVSFLKFLVKWKFFSLMTRTENRNYEHKFVGITHWAIIYSFEESIESAWHAAADWTHSHVNWLKKTVKQHVNCTTNNSPTFNLNRKYDVFNREKKRRKKVSNSINTNEMFDEKEQ